MLRHEYKCLFAYFRNLFIEIFRIVMFILIFYPLELHKVKHDCHTKNNTHTKKRYILGTFLGYIIGTK